MKGKNMKTLWKVACQEDKYPGMWQRWFRNQCVAVGWASKWGYKLEGKTKKHRGWSRVRNVLKEMKVGDLVIVALKGHRVGRLGEIVGMATGDDQWKPLVPEGPKLPDGEMGRRIFVRWDLTTGPVDDDLVVKLPASCRFSLPELRPTASKVASQSIKNVQEAMNDPSNWISLLGKFGYEQALSDYIATYPGRLEDGLEQHPNSRIRELVFKDKTRLDVLLMDRKGRPVIVECKQHGPTVGDINQLRHYMDRLKKEMHDRKARGILVHGGAQKISREIKKEARKKPMVEIVSYRIRVDFS